MTNFLDQAKGLSRNPLGIIALFVSLIYGFACLVLSTSISNLHNDSERLPLVWFIIIFPIVILIAFLFLVTKHHGKLYSPSDYGSADSFLKTLEGAKKFDPIQIDVTPKQKNISGDNSLVRKTEDINLNKGPFSPETKENVDLANLFFKKFLDEINKKEYIDKFDELSFGAQAPEYFIVRFSFPKSVVKLKRYATSGEIIIRVTRDNSGTLKLIAVGKDIIEADYSKFAEKVVDYIDKFSKRLFEE